MDEMVGLAGACWGRGEDGARSHRGRTEQAEEHDEVLQCEPERQGLSGGGVWAH